VPAHVGIGQPADALHSIVARSVRCRAGRSRAPPRSSFSRLPTRSRSADGTPGLISAIEQVFDRSLRQRCLVHRARNVIVKVSRGDQEKVKSDFWSVFDDLTSEPGDEAIAEARLRASAFADKWAGSYPGATACVTDDHESLTTHLRFPSDHWVRIRHTNLVERTFGEAKRRTKVIGRLPGESSCLSLVWAVLDRASRGWRGVKQTPANVRLLQQMRRQLFDPDYFGEEVNESREGVVTTAA